MHFAVESANQTPLTVAQLGSKEGAVEILKSL
jgi:hypothetical protein